ncbi:MAG: methylated-DNA--[protein]-cysteine S-methyltransferase [Defluviitaleaceae bacterium]|nr:methylated-DNA--[protein]-cysteine S-methyltransferase [Defluviitaleaceae bacterium]
MNYTYNSPIGELLICYDDAHITGVYFDRDGDGEYAANPVLLRCIGQLDEYFAGARREFDLPLRPVGTDFQMAVWRALQDIGYGQLQNYGDIARAIGKPKAPRAVGGANNKNPISIIIPCHRVIGASGKMVGYGGGLWRKEWLIQHEKRG